MPKISIIVPVFFNEKNLPISVPALLNTLDSLSEMDGEIVFVDDGSGDGSYAILRDFAAKDHRIKVIRFVKNFGAYMALLAGLDHATGDCIAVIMADLQDPPELIPEMARHWKNGSKLVLAVRQDREDRLIDRMFAHVFWGFIRTFGIKSVPKGGFDFVLFDRRIADIMTEMREKNSHFMLQVVWSGFPPTVIPYTRRKREVGKSKWSFSKKLKLFIDSATAFSYAPVRFMSLLGCMTAFFGFVFAAYVVFNRVVVGVSVQGWTSLMIVILILGGIQMTMMGIIGEYIWRAYDASRQRPPYIIAESLNLPESISASPIQKSLESQDVQSIH